MSCFNCGVTRANRYTALNEGNIEICNNCCDMYNNRFSCSRCSNLIPVNPQSHQISGYFKRGKIYCANCACLLSIINVARFEHRNGNLQGYGYKPNPIFHPNVRRPDNLFLGVELEMGLARSSSNVHNFCDNHAGKIFYFKTDCSIRSYGCEVVTHPCTIDYHRSENSGWKQLLQDAKAAGFKSGSEANTGIHVHLNRDFFSYKDLKKIDLFVNQYRDLWEKIAGRRNCSYCAFRVKRHNDWGVNDGHRYSSVNYCNSNTIELRIFNGNINFENVMAILEICDALGNFAKEVTYEKLYEQQDVVKSEFKELLFNSSKYYYDKNFCITNNIF